MYIINFIIPMLAILLASTFGCAIGNPSNQYTSSQKMNSGWIQSEKKISDSFYFKVSSNAGSNSVSGAKKEFSCKQGAMNLGKESLSDKLLEDLSSDSNNLSLTEFNPSIKDLKVKECRPTSIADPSIPFSEWNSCECMFVAKIDGGKSGLLAHSL
jgi:hypothetical protein